MSDNHELIEALRKAQEDNMNLLQELLRLQMENKQLREALKKCSPFVSGDEFGYACEFCGRGEGHTEDCEYIRLIGGTK